MSARPAVLRMSDVSGAEAVWLLEGSAPRRPVFVRRGQAVVRPARHVWEFGGLIVRTPTPAAAVPLSVTYKVDEVGAETGIGWTVTATGPADVITDPDEAALPHCLKGMGGAPVQRTLPGRVHGLHDTLVRIRSQSLTGFRFTRGAEG
ncbi:pyridoxamine 5'-phosphate oxidase family protein [Streptomyces sp. NPDC047043]|uniref:pyridoxamine 5'-phosphate oxidase family protein n=1 Tax=Streptomyces sp. NPDC047043 TaxID=3154497 RepID=UPI00340E240F